MKCRGELGVRVIKKGASEPVSSGVRLVQLSRRRGGSPAALRSHARMPHSPCLTLPDYTTLPLSPPPRPLRLTLIGRGLFRRSNTFFEGVHMVAIFQRSIWVKITRGGAALFSACVSGSLTSSTLLGSFFLLGGGVAPHPHPLLHTATLIAV